MQVRGVRKSEGNFLTSTRFGLDLLRNANFEFFRVVAEGPCYLKLASGVG